MFSLMLPTKVTQTQLQDFIHAPHRLHTSTARQFPHMLCMNCHTCTTQVAIHVHVAQRLPHTQHTGHCACTAHKLPHTQHTGYHTCSSWAATYAAHRRRNTQHIGCNTCSTQAAKHTAHRLPFPQQTDYYRLAEPWQQLSCSTLAGTTEHTHMYRISSNKRRI